MSIASGTRLCERYEIVSQLGAGGMGEVYRARDLRLSREVAIKVLPEHLSADQQALSRFEREAKALAALSHNNILTIYDFGTDNGISFAVMELLKGETLRKKLSAEKLSCSEAIDVGLEIAEGLTAAHSAGVIHRDLKPENIFITSDQVVKILDFGLARRETSASTEHKSSIETMSRSGIVVGTVPYMSPEQVRGAELDVRTDIFSFGSVLYEMLSGKSAFGKENAADTISAILTETPGSPSNLPEVNQLVQHCLEKNPDKRFQTARDLSFALSSVQKTEMLPAERRLRVPRYVTPVLVAFALIILIGAAFYFFQTKSMHSLAILPFTNVNADPNTEYLSDGITDSIINGLSQIPELKVMSRGTVFTYKGKEVDPKKVGESLNVEAVVTGRVYQQGNTLVVRADLVKVADGSQIWGEQFNRNLSDVLLVQDEISKEIAEKLRIKLTGEQSKQLTKHYTENTEAYQLYLKGLFYHAKEFRPEDYEMALKFYQQATQKDPNYALPYSAMANLYTSMAFVGLLSPIEGYQKAKAAVDKALAIDPNLSDAIFSRGLLSWSYDWDWPTAERLFKVTVEKSPSIAGNRHTYAQSLVAVGRCEQGIAQEKKAQELDPLSPSQNANLGAILFWCRKYDQAIDQFHKSLDLDPNAAKVHDFLTDIYERKKMYDQAFLEHQKYFTLLGDEEGAKAFADDYKLHGYLEARRLEYQAALVMYKQLSEDQYIAPMTFAILYARLNDKDEAFRWLEKAFSERSPWMTYISVDPDFDNIRSDPRFNDLLNRIGLFPHHS